MGKRFFFCQKWYIKGQGLKAHREEPPCLKHCWAPLMGISDQTDNWCREQLRHHCRDSPWKMNPGLLGRKMALQSGKQGAWDLPSSQPRYFTAVNRLGSRGLGRSVATPGHAFRIWHQNQLTVKAWVGSHTGTRQMYAYGFINTFVLFF